MEEKNENSIKGAFLLIFLFLFFVLHSYARDYLNEFVEGGPYIFRLQIEPESEFNLYPVLFYYDYLNKVGNLSFGVSSGTFPELFGVTLPKALEVKDISFYNKSSESYLRKDIDFRWNNFSNNLSNIVELDTFNSSIEDLYVMVYFEGNLSPIAQFGVEFEVNRAQSHKGNFFDFYIEGYKCSSVNDCLSSDLDRFSRYFYYRKNKDLLRVLKIGEFGKREDPDDERFYLRLDPKEFDTLNALKWIFLGISITLFIEFFLLRHFKRPIPREQSKSWKGK